MRFDAPYLLIGLVLIPILVAGYEVLERRRAARSLAWSRREMLPNILRRSSRRLRFVPPALLLLGITSLLVGFARPQRILNASHGNSPTIVLTFDVSGSMAADDVLPSRLRAARRLASQFLKELPTRYRVAVVTFGDTAHLVVTPTFDRSTVLASLPSVVTPEAGTAIGDGVSYAVATAVTAAGLGKTAGIYRPGAVLLFSDGSQTAGGTTPEEAAVSALVDHVPVNAIALGTPEGVVLQTTRSRGVPTRSQISVPVEPSTLRMLSRQTGGMFFEATSLARSPAAMANVYKNLRSYASPGRRTHALSAATAEMGLVLILAGIGLSGLWFGRLA